MGYVRYLHNDLLLLGKTSNEGFSRVQQVRSHPVWRESKPVQGKNRRKGVGVFSASDHRPYWNTMK